MDFVEIDGSEGEGGGQILRTSVSVASVLKRPLRITNIRARRKEPGLKPQHLQAIKSAARLCKAKLKGAEIGSQTIEYVPGDPEKDSKMLIDTGTAGSVTLICQTLIPVAAYLGIDLEATVLGGTEVSFSPTVDYLREVVFPAYARIGWISSIELERRGYYPRGGGRIKLHVDGSRCNTRNVDLVEATREQDWDALHEGSEVRILSVSRSLPRHVCERQTESAKRELVKAGFSKIHSEEDSEGESLSPGSSMLVYRITPESFVGSSSLGERGKKAEVVGSEAAQAFVKEAKTNPSVDSHLADMLVTALSCSSGKSRFSTSNLTSHLTTNLKIVERLACCYSEIEIDANRGNWIVSLSGRSEKSI